MHKLLTDSPGEKMLMLGNEAIARGAIEAGVAFGATYPGTPSSEISEYLFRISHETDLYFEYSTNEKVALEIAAGAAVCGLRSMAVMKHVGMNVAADALMTLAYVGVRGGLVIVCADDPFMFSSQNEQDNRYYGKLSGLPILEPSTGDEAKEMVKYAFDLSEELKEPVILRTTTRINHSSFVVELGNIRRRETRGDFEKNPFRYVTVPAVSRNLHKLLLQNYDKALATANRSPWNRISGDGKWGIACNGVSYNYVQDAVKELGISERTKVLRVGFSHPFPNGLVQEFLKGCERVLVVEEGEPYMEESVKAAAQEAGCTISIRGKGDELFSRLFEFDPALVRRNVARFFGLSEPMSESISAAGLPEIPQRPPNLCAGCPHRATFYSVRKVLGDDAIYPTDIGCYTLGLLPPLSMADFLICMGSSVGTAAGFARATGRKVVAFIGDSTFFHSGLPGLVSAVHHNHNFTLVILDNGTTAMTGHQPHPGVDLRPLGFEGYSTVDIETVVRGLGVKHVTVVEPLKLKKTQEAVKEAVEFKGVSVIISREICPLYAKVLPDAKKTRSFHVAEAKCANHRVCINDLGCPAFYLEDDRVKINENVCIGCAVCAQICPENAILPVKTA
ncbi:MAG: indolepyruvate ferredoxin oxidoreductase subunit alpha [Deltaproteobacteria bacterium]|nr:indolepyruvate ferredoxin oxidoreductase subunit alpha [Deltaproteobacteria bacterium]